MIYKNSQELISRRKGTLEALYIYKGLRLVWTAINSCFSSLWRNDAAWKNNSPWLNN